MPTRERTARINPRLGVNPPSLRALHSSTRCAPPFSAATADSTESTQISSSIITASLLVKLAQKRAGFLPEDRSISSGIRVLKNSPHAPEWPARLVASVRSLKAVLCGKLQVTLDRAGTLARNVSEVDTVADARVGIAVADDVECVESVEAEADCVRLR